MKKITFVLMLIAMVTLSFQSCKKAPSCEADNTGTITMINTYNESIWVDVTYDNSDYNEEAKLAPGKSKTYTMKVGEVTVWFTDQAGYNNNSWYYDYMDVVQCEDGTYTISKKKSSVEGIAKHKTE